MKHNTKKVVKLIIALFIILIASFALPAGATAPQQVYEIPSEIKGDPIKEYAFKRVVDTWGIDYWYSFNEIIKQESKDWNVTRAHNPKLSTAYGLGGFLDGTWSTVGCIKTPDPYIQLDCTVKYIKLVYKTPVKAWEYHLAKNYY